MSIISLKTVQKAVLATVLAAAVAACSTVPGEQTAALPSTHGWVDASQLPAGQSQGIGQSQGDVFVSNGGDAN